MMAELVKYVSQLEKELIKTGANVDEIKETIGKKYEIDKIRNNPNHKGQDDLIIDFQADLALMEKKLDYDEFVMKGLCELRQVNVLVDFAKKVARAFKDMNASVIVRTSYNRFIDLIRFSAAIFQKSREWVDENTIRAMPEDYDNAVDWFTHLFKNECLLPITKDQEKLLSIINESEQATANEIISLATFASRSWVYLNLNLLAEKGFLEKTRIDDETGYSKKKIDLYVVSKKAKLKLPY